MIRFVECTFGRVDVYPGGSLYGCKVHGYQISENTELVFSGTHYKKRSNFDIIYLGFHSCNITKIPLGLTTTFPNLKVLEIHASKLKKIVRQDLADFKNLTQIRFDNNEIETLPGDLFQGIQHLVLISFRDNLIEDIHPNIINGLQYLNYVDFRGNVNYDNWFSNYDRHRNMTNSTLENVTKKIPGSSLARMKRKVVASKNICLDRYGQNDTDDECEVQNVKVFPVKSEKKEQNSEKPTQKLQNLKEKSKNFNYIQISPQKPEHKQRKTLDSDIKSFIQDESTKDFTIKIENRQFRVHKFILAARSPTFAEMFRDDPKTKFLKLDSVPPKVFEKILEFIYTDKVPNDGTLSNFLVLFKAANFLRIEDLIIHAAEKYSENINNENVLEVLKSSEAYNDKVLKDKIFERIKKIYPRIPFKDEWRMDFKKVSMAIDLYHEKEKMIKEIQDNFYRFFE